MDPKALLRLFVTEFEELLASFEDGIITLEKNPSNEDAVHQIFRAAHTLKSNAGMVGFAAIVSLAHLAESLLSRVRAKELTIGPELVSLLLATVDALREMLEQVTSGSAVRLPDAHTSLPEKLAVFEAARSPARPMSRAPRASFRAAPGPRVYRVDMAFRPDLFVTGQDPTQLVLELGDLGEVLEVVVHTSALPPLATLEPTRCYLGFSVTVRTEQPRREVESVFIFVDADNSIAITDVTGVSKPAVDTTPADLRIGELLVQEGCVGEREVSEALRHQKRIGEVLVDLGKIEKVTLDRALAKQAKARRARVASSVRVDIEKLDRLIDLVGEVLISVSQVSKTAKGPAVSHAVAIEALEQFGRDLHAQVMTVRMTPIEDTFNRFQRVVRDLAQTLGKHVALETYGAETELDKTVIEQLADPLKHMVRNAVAHGLELPAERIQSGKGDTGRIELRATQRQGQVVIEVSDDGRGMDPDAILAKALAMGLVSVGERPTDRQILDFLFLPGFSTAKEVDEISGRGVGLDVVRRNVQSLRGSIEVDSTVGRGTTFRIKLPLTLAIIDGMTVRAGRETLTIPLASVVELISPQPNDIATLEGTGELVNVRGRYVPMVRLSDVLNTGPGETGGKAPVVVVVENDARKFGVMVDQVLGMEQTVVKPLDRAFSVVNCLEAGYVKPEGVSGATILGDGSIGLILDVPGLEHMAFGDAP